MRSSYIWAAAFAIAIGGWLASGSLSTPADPDKVAKKGAEQSTKPVEDVPFAVQVATFSGRNRPAFIELRGRTEAFKTVEVRARTSGIVENSPAREGSVVTKGDLLCELDLTSRRAKLLEARAMLASAKRDFEATEKLAKRKFAAASKLASDKAKVDAAMAQLEQVEWDIKWTKIRAPLAGVIAERPAELGSYVQAGSICARITVLDPIVISGQVSERNIAQIKTGQKADVKLITGEELSGTLRYISPKADVSTRTFKVEIEVPNPDRSVRDGLTAEINLPLPKQTAHLIPASLISLNDSGKVGVYAVTADKKVKFLEIKLLDQTREGAWVSGLPETVTLITLGQHYVLDGQVVTPVPAEAGTSEPAS